MTNCINRIVLFACFLSSVLCRAQEYPIRLISDQVQHNLWGKFPTSTFYNQQSLLESTRNVQQRFIEQGYLTASLDSLKLDTLNQHWKVYFSVGAQYRVYTIHRGNVDEAVISRSGIRMRPFRKSAVDTARLSRLLNKLVVHYENHGYPFARVHYVVDTLNQGGVTLSLNAQPGPLVQFDSINLYGDAKISENYLRQYVGIIPGDLYNEKRIQNLSTRLAELPFVAATQAPEVIFQKNKALLNLYLENKRASTFNGVVGFLPDETTGDLTITGDVQLDLLNVLGKGERFKLNWRRLQTNTQNLIVQAQAPYLFKTNLGINGTFDLYRRDSTFTNLQLKAGVQYFFSNRNFLEGTLKQNTSNIIYTAGFEALNELPPTTSTSITAYGLAYTFNNLNYLLNPTRGFSISFSASIGEKEVIPENQFENLDYSQIEPTSQQYELQWDAAAFLPLFPQTTLKFRLLGAHLQNEYLFTNELFRIGGLNTLRGFDEEVFFASSYAIPSIEFRYLLEQRSYLAAFIDYGWYERNTVAAFETDTPLGFGAGLSFETRAGIFSLFYALGQQFDNPVLWRSGKIHFGFASLF